MNIVAFNPDAVKPRMDALGIPWTGMRCYMVAEKFWNEARKRRDFRVYFLAEEAAATPFATAEDAWLAFDRSGVGRRSDYEILPYKQQ